MTVGQALAQAPLRRALPERLASLELTGLEYDSRRVKPGFLFFAFAGSRAHGPAFAQSALDQGAIAVVSEEEAPEGLADRWIGVGHGRRALAAASRAFYGNPDEWVQFTGITGTNGKTTTALLAESVLKTVAKGTGLIGTIEYRMMGEARPAPNTTPESLDIMRFAAELEQRGGNHLISEVSSHALSLGRVAGIHFHTAVFTNLTQDHLDHHGTMDAYAAAKRLLFVPEIGPAPKYAVLNADVAESQRMQPADGTEVIWYGSSEKAELRAERVEMTFEGLRFELCWRNTRTPIASPLVGDFNVSNVLAAAGVGVSYGLTLDQIAAGISACRAVPGRFERVDAGQPFLVVVDYAHTDDALRNAIRTARNIARGKVITLFGCGGDRDRSKRPLMGMAAAELSDFVVLTSDNPRSEDPLSIMNDALVGLRRFDTPSVSEPDRAKAIALAVEHAEAGDVVLLAGKGHETYQILRDRTIAFDDREVARRALQSLGFGEAR